jgi:hypothetical protein
MSKLIFIPDIHGRIRAVNHILEVENDADVYVFSNDCFDWFHDGAVLNGQVAKWLKPHLDNPKHVWLMSNHVQSYTWSQNPLMMCSGFEPQKLKEIYKYTNQDDLKKCKLAFYHSGILFSHAGISEKLLSFMQQRGYDIPSIRTGEAIYEWITEKEPIIYDLCDKLQGHPLIEAGMNRGGDNEVGGLTWEDFGSHVPLPGVPQVVGHSILRAPTFVVGSGKDKKFISDVENIANIGDYTNNGWTLDIDTNNRHYLVVENRALYIKEIIAKNEKLHDPVIIARINY